MLSLMTPDQTTDEPAAIDSAAATVRVPLLDRVTCPHCWHSYPPEKSVWISSDHPSLRGDPKAGEDEPRRFSAERFDIQGNGLDARNQRTQGLACPECHLEVPRALYEYRPFFVSIVGAPGSGKSFFLPAMTWFMRSSLPEKIAVSFQDADPRLNLRVHEYEKTLFLNPDRETPVTLEKTRERGMENIYDEVTLGTQTIQLLRPFVFRMEPTAAHRGRNSIATMARAVCMYDNAGEQFLAAAEGIQSRLTNHLQHCDLTLFMFDPTQHPRFREAAQPLSSDPQWNPAETNPRAKGLILQNTILQNTILDTAASRLRKLRGLALQQRYDGPLVVVVTKLDAWVKVLPPDMRNRLLSTDYLPPSADGGGGGCRLRSDAIATLSRVIRTMLLQLAPEIVAAAEGFSTDVTYIPVSATGCSVRQLENGAYGVRPRHIQPKWCELPLLVGLWRANVPLVQTTTTTSSSATAP